MSPAQPTFRKQLAFLSTTSHLQHFTSLTFVSIVTADLLPLDLLSLGGFLFLNWSYHEKIFDRQQKEIFSHLRIEIIQENRTKLLRSDDVFQKADIILVLLSNLHMMHL
jgi:hypothetical protein